MKKHLAIGGGIGLFLVVAGWAGMLHAGGINIGDHEFSYDYPLAAINAGPAYANGYYGHNVTVAVQGTGINPQHSELSGQVVPGYDYSTETSEGAFSDATGHETAMGGLIAARKNSRHGHGVAPEAKLLPLRRDWKISDLTEEAPIPHLDPALYNFLTEKNIKIINNSLGQRHRATALFNDEKVWLKFPPGYYPPEHHALYKFHAKKLARALAAHDIISVWGTGNDGWNTQHKLEFWNNAQPGQTFSISRKSFIRSAIITEPAYSPTAAATIAMKDITNVQRAMPYLEALFPFFALPHAELLTAALAGEPLVGDDLADYEVLAQRWLAVAAVDANNKIAPFSNGCGPAKNWCLAAPGELVKVVSTQGEQIHKVSGTSPAAALVSGALAVLQAAFPAMEMTALKEILLRSATKVGAGPWPNEIYGHGIINLGAALKMAAQSQGEEFPLLAQTRPANELLRAPGVKF